MLRTASTRRATGALAFVLVLAACGGGATDAVDDTASQAAAQVPAAGRDGGEANEGGSGITEGGTETTAAIAAADDSTGDRTGEGPAPSETATDDPGPALGLVPLPPQPAGVPFPTEAWPEADLTEHLGGSSADTVRTVVDDAFAESAPYGGIEAVLVVAGGELVVERYGRGYDGTSRHVSWSVGKSVTHAMLGILSREGLLDIFAPAAVPEWSSPGDPRAAITPDMLARMSSGLRWVEAFDALALVSAAPEIEAATVQAERDLAAEPDSLFNYSTGSTAINGRLIGELVGTGTDLRAWAAAELFTPLGIDSVELVLDGSGHFVGGYGANMTARDFARFGLLYQRDGVWDGRRILPEGWVDYARTPSATTDDYGSGFWLAGDRFSAAGFAGQRVVIVPEHDLVVVILATELNDGPVGRLITDLLAPFDAG